MVHEILQPFLFDCPYEDIRPEKFVDSQNYREDMDSWTVEKNLFDLKSKWVRQIALSDLESTIGTNDDFESFVEKVLPLDRLFLVDDRAECNNPMWKRISEIVLRCWLWWMSEAGINVSLVPRKEERQKNEKHT